MDSANKSEVLGLGAFGGCFDGTVQGGSYYSAIVCVLYLLIFILVLFYYLYNRMKSPAHSTESI